MSERVDAVVIGAGAVGLAVAERLSRRPNGTVVVLERHERHGVETSSRNSEVVHSGLYYAEGSLKAKLCVKGRRMLYDLASRHELLCRRTGKLIVACDEDEIPKLEALRARGQANGVDGLEILDQRTVSALEPAVRARAALLVPETGIMDSEAVMRFYRARAEDQGVIFLWKTELRRVEREAQDYRLWVNGMDEPILAAAVVNSAGLAADRVAAMAGIDPDQAGYRLHYFKGEYWRIRRDLPVRRLIYPLPGPHGLGIHLTIDTRGGLRLGPNAFPVDRLDYEIDRGHAPDFLKAASRYLPGLREEDLAPDTSGIRPKLAADGSFRDFIVAEESGRGLPGWVNLVGIESPGLTAGPAIAELVADLIGF